MRSLHHKESANRETFCKLSMTNLISIFLSLLLFGCAGPGKTLMRSGDTIELTTTGVGESEELATKSALREAVTEASGLFLYSTSKVVNRVLLSDKISTYAPGIITSYKVIDANKVEGLISVTVYSIVRKDLLKERIEHLTESQTISSEAKLQELRSVTDTQQRLLEGKELMSQFLGSSDDFFERAYHVNITGYEITQISASEVKGNYYAEISLNKVFWETYKDILKILDTTEHYEITKSFMRDFRKANPGLSSYISDPDAPLIKTTPQGMYGTPWWIKREKPRLRDEYNIPTEIPAPPAVELRLSATTAQGYYKNHNMYKLQRNILELATGYVPAKSLKDEDIIHYSGLFSGIEIYRSNAITIVFPDKVALKIPFRFENASALQEFIRNNKVAWEVSIR